MTAAAPERFAQSRIVHVEHCMGTVFTIDVRDEGDWRDAIAEVVAWLHQADAVFSTYRDDSDINRLARNDIRLADAHPDVAVVLELCAQAQERTHGAFTAAIGGRIDPTGLVKGWAIERASQILRRHGSAHHAVNGGGDMQLAGHAAPGRPWSVGIVDPANRDAILTVVQGSNVAVATSGTAERGLHVNNPFTGEPVTDIVSASVIGPALTFADCYATAAMVFGPDAAQWINGIEGYESLVVTADGERLASNGWHNHSDKEETHMSIPRSRGYWFKLAGFVGAGAIAGVIGASALNAGAATSATTTSVAATSSSSSSAPSTMPGAPRGDHDGDGPRGDQGGPGGPRGDEHSLSATVTAKLKAEALTHVPGGTVERVESDSGDATYEVHMTNASGNRVTVKFDKNQKFVAVEAGMGK